MTVALFAMAFGVLVALVALLALRDSHAAVDEHAGWTWYERLALWLEERDRLRIIPDREHPERPYLSRYYLIGNQASRWFAVALHRFHQGDSDAHRHDHPWWCWLSIVLAGGYWEDTVRGWFFRRPGDVQLHTGDHAHRVALDQRSGPVWTLFVMGPRLPESRWGFHTPAGWVCHSEYLGEDGTRAHRRPEPIVLIRDRDETSRLVDQQDDADHGIEPIEFAPGELSAGGQAILEGMRAGLARRRDAAIAPTERIAKPGALRVAYDPDHDRYLTSDEAAR